MFKKLKIQSLNLINISTNFIKNKYIWGCSNETNSGTVLGRGTYATKRSPHEHWGRQTNWSASQCFPSTKHPPGSCWNYCTTPAMVPSSTPYLVSFQQPSYINMWPNLLTQVRMCGWWWPEHQYKHPNAWQNAVGNSKSNARWHSDIFHMPP